MWGLWDIGPSSQLLQEQLNEVADGRCVLTAWSCTLMRRTVEGAISAAWGLFSSATRLSAETHFGGYSEPELFYFLLPS